MDFKILSTITYYIELKKNSPNRIENRIKKYALFYGNI